jgi:hypothetical protein
VKAALYSRRTRRRFGKAESLTALAAAKQRDPMERREQAMTPWMKVTSGAVALLVLAGTTTIGLVVVGTQIGFYRARMGVQVVDFSPLPIPAIDLPVFTPLATEGVVWMCTLMAVVLVLLNRPAGIWTRSMWLFAAIAAVVNMYRAAWLEHDLLGGIVTGGLSIAGPYTVHLFVVWIKHVRIGRTLEQVRIDTEIRWALWAARVKRVALAGLDAAVQPRVFIRTVNVWRTFRGIPWTHAWFIASKDARARVITRYRKTGVEDAADVFADALDDNTVLQRTVDAWTQGVLGGRTQGSTSVNTRMDRRREQPPRPASKPADSQPDTPVDSPRPVSVNTGISRQDTVIAEYWTRVEQGGQTEGVNISELARTLFDDPSARPTVSRVWNACLRGEYPNPNGGEQ